MELKFNSTKNQEWIDQVFQSTMNEIKNNLSKGIRVTEIYLPKEISFEVRDKIVKEIEGKEFTWMVVRHDYNQYTGKPQSFISDTIGDEMYYKLKYYGQ